MFVIIQVHILPWNSWSYLCIKTVRLKLVFCKVDDKVSEFYASLPLRYVKVPHIFFMFQTWLCYRKTCCRFFSTFYIILFEIYLSNTRQKKTILQTSSVCFPRLRSIDLSDFVIDIDGKKVDQISKRSKQNKSSKSSPPWKIGKFQQAKIMWQFSQQSIFEQV